jgi:ABC-type multidrug transport system fused ATPase/permease subunit
MRLLPNVQAFFGDAAQIRYHKHMIDTLYTDMMTLSLPPDVSDAEVMVISQEILPFTHRIILQGITFSYPTSPEPVLQEISLSIAKDKTVGFVGATGCGKTTLVDVIMGLLLPTGGAIVVDNVPVVTVSGDAGNGQDITRWQRNFGYVPQQIYLSDDTVAANIAFGIPGTMRDMAAVEQAAQAANLHEFITTGLPKGYETVVGERGIRLSGGQRQRIGIARSLYHDPNVLVMDEATSALDSITEDAVMDAVHNLMHSKTIIIIAHRLSTVRECDMIYLMEKGKIITQGGYDELIQTSPQFKAMAKVGK